MEDSDRLKILHAGIDVAVEALDNLRSSDLSNSADDELVDISDRLRRAQNAARRS